MSIIYTPSAMSDKIKEFFNTYKMGFEYKYVQDIDSSVLLSKEIVINYNEFTPEIKSMLEEQQNEQILTAFERAIGEIFQARHGSSALESIKRENGIKFKFINYGQFQNEDSDTSNVESLESHKPGNSNKPVEEIMEFLYKKIIKLIKSKEDPSKIYAIIQVNGHYETFEIDEKSTRLQLWLKTNFRNETGTIHSVDSFKQAIDYVKGNAISDNKTINEKIHNRIAFDGQVFYYDLCSPDWKFVKISKDSVEIVSQNKDTPAFIRTQIQCEQVLPNLDFKGNPLIEFCKLERLDPHFAIHLVAYFISNLKCCIALMSGSSGSLKTTITAHIKRVVDPRGENTNEDQVSSIPIKIDDLILQFYNNYLVVFENVSYITNEISDVLCKATTGSMFSKRKHYENLEEVMIKILRKIVVNGISPNFDRDDLIQRTIVYHTTIPSEEDRLTDEDVEEKFRKLLPDLLGQIFFTLQKVLNTYDSVKDEIKSKSRMASFLVYGEVISRSLDNEPNDYVKWFNSKTETAITEANETSPLIPYLNFQNIDDKKDKKWLIQFQDFQHKLKFFAESNNYDTTGKSLPKYPKNVRSFLQRHATILEQNNYKYEIIDNYTENTEGITKNSTVIVFFRKIIQATLGDKQ